MEWFKKLFSFKKKEEEKTLDEVLDEVEKKETGRICESCNKPILEGEHWSKQVGKYFHKKCYKNILKGM